MNVKEGLTSRVADRQASIALDACFRFFHVFTLKKSGYHTDQRSITKAARITEVTLWIKFKGLKGRMQQWNC